MGSGIRIGIVGGGVAGTLLAWRLATLPRTDRPERIELVLGDARRADATRASGGAVRGYEPGAAQRALALASLRELLDSPRLRRWAGYRRTGSIYVHGPGVDALAAVDELDAVLPGSVELVPGGKLTGWAGLPDGAVAVTEHEAGHLSPDRLRTAVLRELVGLVDLATGPVTGVRVPVSGPARCTVGGQDREYDILVIAAGGWTPELLRGQGLPHDGYRTKAIQCTVYASAGWTPPPFVDETSGLYGKPTFDRGVLLGVPSEQWGVPPGTPPVSPQLHERAARLAAARLPDLRLGRVLRRVAATDCYVEPPVLTLRAVPGTRGAMFTFTGGSGGAAKTVLAASARAATHLLDQIGQHDAHRHDARQHDARQHEARQHEARQHEARQHEARQEEES